ncbi:MAG: LysR family transcriptional regulator [Thalassovita sp.]
MSADPFNVDFAALRTLRLVHAHGSFSRAAESLGVTQSTVSYAVSRLRDTFKDPLFVRQGAGIVPTERCTEIVTQSSELLDRFEAMAAPRDFDPAVASIEIGVSCNFYERVTILPEVIRVLRRDAPGMKLRIISSTVRGKEQLVRSESDILIGPIQIEEAGYYRRSLMTDDYVCVMDVDNPLASQQMDMATCVSAPQIVVNYGGNFRSRFLVVLEAQGYFPNAVIEVPSPANLADLLQGTDLIAIIPARMAGSFGKRVAVVPCPFTAEVSIDLFWTARTHVSAPHVWLRSVIAAAANRLVAQENAG